MIMEKDKASVRSPDGMHEEKQDMKDVDLHIDRNVSGEDITEEGADARRHHQAHGNRRYESYRNHSSADDQPHVDTSW